MAALASDIGLLFRIKADNSQATREIEQTKAGISGLASSATAAGGSFAAFANPVTLATVAVAAMATASAAAVSAIWDLTKSTSEYGSAIFDATQKTGLGAQTMSALKHAAETSGSSFEKISGSVAKFNVLLGEANQGNEKARATLEQYNITAKDTDGALAQAIKRIAEMKTADEQAAAAKALFKDRTAEILPVIKSFDGDLPGLISKLKDLGVTMTDEDARAADEFGDTLDTLNAQAAAVGRQFAFELMPAMTGAMASISKAMADNKGAAREWGDYLVNVARGVSWYFEVLGKSIASALNAVSFGFTKNATAAWTWADTINAAVRSIFPNLSLALSLLARLGMLKEQGNGIDSGVSTLLTPGDSVFDFSKGSRSTVGARGGGGGGAGGGGGRNAANDAEQARQKEIQAAETAMKRRIELAEKASEQELKVLDAMLAKKEINEMAYLEKVRAIKERDAKFEATQYSQFANNPKLNGEEAAEAKHRVSIAQLKVRIEELNTQIEIAKQDGKHLEFLGKAKADLEKVLEKERERLKLAKEMREQKEHEFRLWRKEQREKIDPYNLGKEKKGVNGEADWELGAIGSFMTGIGEALGIARDGVSHLIPLMQQLGTVAVGALSQFASALGQVVQNWVLMGTTGPAVLRKMLAAVLASIAAESAVRAIFELAKGFASLFLNPAEAAAHFKAAALFGSIAVGAGLAGRAAAGDAFRQQTAAATGSSTTSSGQGERGRGGSVYSSQENKIIETGAIRPAIRSDVHLTLKLDSNGVIDVVRDNIRRNGALREVILETV